MSAPTKIFAIIGGILLIAAAWIGYQVVTDRWIVLTVPFALESGATISQKFTVDTEASYRLLIDCERTADTEDDLNDALIDGLEVEASITTSGRLAEKLDCSDPEHMSWWRGHIARVLCTFTARPRERYNVTMHIIRYGQGVSSRDHKLAGTWDENLTIPADARPTLKVEIDPLSSYISMAGSPSPRFCALSDFFA